MSVFVGETKDFSEVLIRVFVLDEEEDVDEEDEIDDELESNLNCRLS